jgi:hypothetical protein
VALALVWMSWEGDHIVPPPLGTVDAEVVFSSIVSSIASYCAKKDSAISFGHHFFFGVAPRGKETHQRRDPSTSPGVPPLPMRSQSSSYAPSPGSVFLGLLTGEGAMSSCRCLGIRFGI